MARGGQEKDESQQLIFCTSLQKPAFPLWRKRLFVYCIASERSTSAERVEPIPASRYGLLFIVVLFINSGYPQALLIFHILAFLCLLKRIHPLLGDCAGIRATALYNLSGLFHLEFSVVKERRQRRVVRMSSLTARITPVIMMPFHVARPVKADKVALRCVKARARACSSHSRRRPENVIHT